MKRSPLRLGCVVAAVILLALLVVGGSGLWWFFAGQYTTAAAPPASPVQVFLLSPASGHEVRAGDYVPIDLQAVAPEAIMWAEVVVDGVSLGASTESPERASWTWQAWPAGVHVLAGRAQAVDGQWADSQTVIVNVVATDDTMQVRADAGQGLGALGAKFGATPNQMADANPQLDPSKPLEAGQLVNVPTSGSQIPAGGGATAGGGGPGAGSVPFFIGWELKLKGQVDKSYCYLSDGSGTWDKMPKQPFEFFGGLNNLYTQVFDVTPPSAATIQAQCWGWLGGALKFLGQGETKVISGGPIQVVGEGFELVGIPQLPEATGGPAEGEVTPPFALREAVHSAECASHGNPLLAAFVCETLLKAPVKEYVVLVWEWQPELCWPGYCKYGINKIDGYMVYEMDPITQASTYFLKQVNGASQEVTAIPLPWGAHCYGVTALAGGQESEMATYCPGKSSQMKTMTLTALENWITAADMLEQGEDCLGFDEGYGKYGQGMGEVLAGAYNVDSDSEDCLQNVYYNGAVKFKIAVSQLPAGAVMQKATLRFTPSLKLFSVLLYSDGDPLSGGPLSCVAAVGRATQAWSGLSDADHWINFHGLGAYGAPTISVSDAGPIALNVTAVVADWLKNPGSNHGFIVYGENPPSGPSARCVSSQTNFQLDIDYFVP